MTEIRTRDGRVLTSVDSENLRCAHVWRQRLDRYPRQCPKPKCKSLNRDVPRKVKAVSPRQ